MPLFNYSARNQDGSLVKGQIEATNKNAVAQALIKRGVIPLNISESTSRVKGQTDSTRSGSSQLAEWFVPKVTLDDLVIFSRQMYSLMKSGIPILRAVKGLAETTSSKRMQTALLDVGSQLERGRSFSSALNAWPDSKAFLSARFNR